jgi:hypothetical protein
MIGRVAIIALAIGLTSCAGLEPAGRNASRSPRATTTASTPAPAPTPPRPVATTPAPSSVQTPPPVAQQPAPAPAATAAPQRVTPAPTATAPSVAAPRVTAPPSTSAAPTAPRSTSADEDVVVPGQTQVPAPQGDPRSNEERMADIRAWDQCVMQVQNAFDADPMRPQLTTPEEYCRESLGMNERMAVPISRRRR